MRSVKWVLGTGALALSLVISGCAKKDSATESELAATQKQLDEANKKLESAGMQPVAPPPPAAGTGATGQAGGGGAAGQPGSAASQTAAKGNSPVETSRPGWGDSKPAPVPAGPVNHTLEAGTPIAVRTAGMISTKTAASGSTFQANLHQPLEVDGYVIAPRGAAVEGVVLESDPGGRVKGVASITVGLRRIILPDGRSLAITTDNRGAVARTTKRNDAVKVGVMSGIGAAIGAIAGGGKGAAIGAGAGAAGGTGVVLGTRGAPAEIAAESVLTFKLAAPVSVQELKR